MSAERAVDRKALVRFTKMVSGSAQQSMNCALTLIGIDLGLFAGLAALGSTTSVTLAEHTELSERWVREWLYQQACARQIDYDAQTDRFSLSPEAGVVFLDEDHPAYLGGMLQSVVALRDTFEQLPENFRTGIGQSYEARGEACACGVERMSRQYQTHSLVPKLLPRLDGVVERLESGIRVADVGCGSATATIAMADAFPRSEFVGFETSRIAIRRANMAVARAGVSNVRVADATHDPLPEDGSFGFVTTFDVVHDATHPIELIQAIRASLTTEGTWFCADVQGRPTFAENLADNPIAPMAYCFSLLVCMSAALSVPGGAGLGTLGFHEQRAREMTAASGFTRFRRIDIEGDNFNAFYEIRP